MKRMRSNGFTIVESMIVLGVSGVLLLAAVAMMNGQQTKARFRSAMTDITTKIEATINEAGSGYYPQNVPFACSQVAGDVQVVAGATAQGSNQDCIYLGRAMMFGILPATDPEQYITHTLVGLRWAGGQEVTSFQQAHMHAVAPNFSSVDLSETKILQYGATVHSMRRVSDGNPIVGVAFVLDPGQNGYSGTGELKSGSAITSVIPILGAGTPGLAKTDGVAQIATQFSGAVAPPTGSVEICFQSGAVDQSGLVTIGAGGSNNAVDLEIFMTPDCS